MELNLKGQRWLINCSYNSSKALIGKYLKLLGKNLDLQSSKYERFGFIVDFNVGMKNEAMNDFCNSQGLTNKPISYKNPANPSCIDLILKNCPRYF